MVDHYDGNIPPHDRRGFIHKKLIGGFTGLLTRGPGGVLPGFFGGGSGGAPPAQAFADPRGRPNAPDGGPCTIPRGWQYNAAGQCVPSRARRESVAVTKVPGIQGVAERFFGGGATGFEVVGPGGGGMAMELACPSGYHRNKSTYWTQTEGVVIEGTKCVRNRRRNPLNPRAARRSMSRLSALAGEMKKLDKTLRKIAPRR